MKLPDDVKAKLLPDSEYKSARFIKDTDGWDKTVKDLGSEWQEQVISAAK